MSATARNKQQRTNHALDSLSLRVQAEQIADRYLPIPGRPSRIQEPDTVQLLLAALTDGATREDAARIAGIAPKTFYNWLNQADTGNEAAQAFLQAVEKAEAEVKIRCTRNVLKAGDMPQFWAASMTYLERKDPDKWGKRSEDGNGPRVVVQIGIRDSDVSISLDPDVPRNDLATVNQG